MDDPPGAAVRWFVMLGLACGPPTDSDLDGLSDRAERQHGTDPTRPDTDEDRLDDGLEVELGTDPLVQDTDGDGYLDGDEWAEVRDPTDPKSVIYTGGWPYYPFKGEVRDALSPVPNVGQRFPRLFDLDQFGDEMDLYDFFDDGRDILLHVCSTAGPYCDTVPNYLATQATPLRDAIVAGDVHFITAIVLGPGGPTTGPDVLDWVAAHPDLPGPVLLDADMGYSEAARLQFFPTVVLLDSTLTVVVAAEFGSTWLTPLAEAQARL